PQLLLAATSDPPNAPNGESTHQGSGIHATRVLPDSRRKYPHPPICTYLAQGVLALFHLDYAMRLYDKKQVHKPRSDTQNQVDQAVINVVKVTSQSVARCSQAA